ncbi:solute carrier family 15 member 1b isoform X2 [Tachysurus fulvidraco]|uniref:solute carrier family 15 member 1b isoform X2 n=1 Tax=Tachysurus fulvidraco TaxID=1234273 RepID=UPI001FF03D77|nr:solute carrier family 15 member 1b isoform X2 [Tachysurus fulvidraco]
MTGDMADREQGKEKKNKDKAECCGYPVSIFFIVVNEFCERFSYYGMRAVLVLYFRYFLRWDDDFATTIYHTFVALCYLTPILGAIIADSWLGKFKTIVYLSIVYTIGQAVMAISAVHDITDANKDGTPDSMTFHVAMSMVGLLLIALGTGGIKPCVAAFGGDQFQDNQEKQRSTFFSIFYLSINAGSLLSTIITPILRAQECGINSQQKCYPLAFGVPAALMAVALVVFILGSSMYIKEAPKGNILMDVCSCIAFANKNRWKHRGSCFPKKEHWLDWAEEKYDKLLIAQVKMVLKVLFLYIPLPMFWALFDQQGSRWTLQATTMNGNFGLFTVQPDQMQTVNPILILLMVPVVDNVVYPLIKKCGLNFTPLKRMTVGMFLAALAFVAAALVQVQIDQTVPVFPSSSEAQVKFLNLENSVLSISVNGNPHEIQPFQSYGYVSLNTDTMDLTVGNKTHPLYPLMKGERQTLLLTYGNIQGQSIDLNAKPEQGDNDIRFVNGYREVLSVKSGSKDMGSIGQFEFSNYTLFPEGTATFIISGGGGQCEYSMDLGFGSSYTLFIPNTFTFGLECASTIQRVEDIQPNTMHMAWQIPQLFLMTCGEVVFSVTGLEFSYSQAPKNMKSVLQAGWLLTTAVGNIIVLIVAEVGQLPEQWAEYVLFAALLICVCVIFSIMAHYYTYIDPAEIEAQFAEYDPEEKEKKKAIEMQLEPVFEKKQTKI